mmetsp:Transcript_9557/g.15644  ORF Transcript_9557/g.15644 Transcript_9557/m.15644 type:complete len:133 (+) Transcript_9557:340-738(+)
MTRGPTSLEEGGLRREMRNALTELSAAALIMELVWPLTNANVRLDGLVNFVRFLYANKLAFTMATAHIQIHVHVNEVGQEVIVRYLFVHKTATMEFVLRQMSVSVFNGRMNGEMDELAVAFHCSRSPMGILN